MNQKLRPSLEDLRVIVGGVHPGELFVITFKVCAGITELKALGKLATALQINILPDELLPEQEDDRHGWSSLRARQRLIRILPLFEWQAFEKLLDYGKIQDIELFTER